MSRSLLHSLGLLAIAFAAGCSATNDFPDTRRDTGSSDALQGDTGDMDATVAMDSSLDSAADGLASDTHDVSRDVQPDVACADGGSACGTTCVNLSSDVMNCGHCGVVCGAAQLCRVGSCVANPCPSNQTPCAPDGGVTNCVNLMTDINNCGTCGTTCPTGNECAAGMCLLVCATGQVHCGATCTTLATDVMNCGACGHACGAGQTCVTGACRCTAPATACGTACTSLLTDTNNCGACGVACGPTSYCTAGHCVTCLSPSTLCPMGVCTNTMSDAANCGACGMACPTGNVCTGGTCICPSGSMVCSGTCVNLQTNAMNCGACGTACPAAQVCVAGACIVAPLYHGWASPIAGCSSTSYNTMAATALGGSYPYNTGDSNACRAWKLAATVCTTQPVMYSDANNWSCPISGGFTDPVFGTYCRPTGTQYACSTCPGACNAGCIYNPLSLRNCTGAEVAQP